MVISLKYTIDFASASGSTLYLYFGGYWHTTLELCFSRTKRIAAFNPIEYTFADYKSSYFI